MKISIPQETVVPQYAEQLVQTTLLSDMLITLTEIARHIKDPNHTITGLDFNFNTIDKYVSDLRLEKIKIVTDIMKELQEDTIEP